MESTKKMSNISKESQEENLFVPYYYGFYSQKMKDQQTISKLTIKDNHFGTSKYIYYKDYEDNIVEITFVTKKMDHDLKWDDVVFVGNLKEFYKISNEPITKI